MATAITTAPRTIKAYAATKPGLECEPFEYVSRPLGDQDVEIAITHCGICGTDLHTVENGWGITDFPVVPGHEIVGHITAVGANVTDLQVGDRVGVGAMVFSCQQKDTCKECGDEQDPYCSKFLFTYNSKYEDGEKTYGGYAESVRVLSHYAFKIPDELPSDATAPLLCAGVTVYSPMKQNVKAGDRVGIVGIGGLGHLGIQFARAMDAAAIAFSHSPNKEAAARELGANDFIVMSDPESVKRGARSVDVLLVTADAENQPWDLYLSFIAPRGKLVLVGLPADRVSFSPFSLVPTGVSFVGSLIGGIVETKEMLELAAKKNVRAVIQKMPMSQVNEGLKLVHKGKVRYRVVLENPSAATTESAL